MPSSVASRLRPPHRRLQDQAPRLQVLWVGFREVGGLGQCCAGAQRDTQGRKPPYHRFWKDNCMIFVAVAADLDEVNPCLSWLYLKFERPAEAAMMQQEMDDHDSRRLDEYNNEFLGVLYGGKYPPCQDARSSSMSKGTSPTHRTCCKLSLYYWTTATCFTTNQVRDRTDRPTRTINETSRAIRRDVGSPCQTIGCRYTDTSWE